MYPYVSLLLIHFFVRFVDTILMFEMMLGFGEFELNGHFLSGSEVDAEVDISNLPLPMLRPMRYLLPTRRSWKDDLAPFSHQQR